MPVKTAVVSIGLGVAMLLAAVAPADAADVVAYKVVDKNSIPKSLTGKLGDPKNGRAVAINRRKGNCLGCHKMPIPEQPFHGLVGPDLAGVASRLSEGQIRLRVVDSKVVNPDTIMPAFYRASGFHRVLKKFDGKTVISAQEVEDIVAYLMTLK